LLILNENSLLNLFLKTSRKLFKLFFYEFEKIKLHPGQIPIFLLLLNENNLTQVDIANKVCVKPSTITIILRKMEKNNLIEKKIDKNNRRVFYISLTEKGKLVAAQAKMIIEKIEGKITAGIDIEEKERLKYLLLKIISEIDNISKRS